jgi:hypothetical protein
MLVHLLLQFVEHHRHHDLQRGVDEELVDHREQHQDHLCLYLLGAVV